MTTIPLSIVRCRSQTAHSVPWPISSSHPWAPEFWLCPWLSKTPVCCSVPSARSLLVCSVLTACTFWWVENYQFTCGFAVVVCIIKAAAAASSWNVIIKLSPYIISIVIYSATCANCYSMSELVIHSPRPPRSYRNDLFVNGQSHAINSPTDTATIWWYIRRSCIDYYL